MGSRYGFPLGGGSAGLEGGDGGVDEGVLVGGKVERGIKAGLAGASGPWGTEMRSCSSSVLVQETAEQVASVDPGWRVAADEGHSSGWIRRLKL